MLLFGGQRTHGLDVRLRLWGGATAVVSPFTAAFAPAASITKRAPKLSSRRWPQIPEKRRKYRLVGEIERPDQPPSYRKQALFYQSATKI